LTSSAGLYGDECYRVLDGCPVTQDTYERTPPQSKEGVMQNNFQERPHL
jgi:hypothetical protein